jgi:hypothetical protein
MRTTMLMTTAATALLLTAGAVPAETLKNVAPERAPAAQRNAPAEKIAPPMHAGERKMRETAGQGGQALEPGHGANVDLKGTVGAGAHANKSGAKAGTDTDMKVGEKASDEAKDTDSADSKSSSSGQSASQQFSQSATGHGNTTVGQGAAAGSAKLSSQQRSQITSIIQTEKVTRLKPADLNVSIRVGAKVPAHVHFYPLPTRVVEIYPA